MYHAVVHVLSPGPAHDLVHALVHALVHDPVHAPSPCRNVDRLAPPHSELAKA